MDTPLILQIGPYPAWDEGPLGQSFVMHRYFEAAQLSTEWSSLKDAEDELLISALSMLCPFSPEDKQALLEAPSLTTRRETLVTLIEFALRGGSGEEVMQ